MIPAYSNDTKQATCDNGVIFTIDEDDMSFIFGILRNNMYSNNIKIVVQEYLCNGRDAHREAKTASKQMDVHLPNYENPTFTVRDYGNSLSYEQMVSVFCKYGKSTKRGTNQTGGFGLGAKSAWAYGSEFFVDTFIDGKMTSYRFYIDNDTQRGKMEVTSTAETDQENGLKVTVPVNENDFDSFRNWYSTITHFWGVKPEVDSKVYYFCDDDKVIFEDDWILYTNHYNNSATILVDDIPYPIDSNALKEVLEEKHLKLLNKPLHLFCGSDNVHVAATREQLNYTKMTIDYLKEEIVRAYNGIHERIESEINGCKTYLEAVKLWHKEHDDKYTFYREYFPEVKWGVLNLNIQKTLQGIPHVGYASRSNHGNEALIYHVYNNWDGKYEFSNDGFIRMDTLQKVSYFILVDGNKCIPRQKIKCALEKLYKDDKVSAEYKKAYVIILPTNEENRKQVIEYLDTKVNIFKLNGHYLSDLKPAKNSSKKEKKKEEVFLKSININNGELTLNMYKDIGEISGHYCFCKYTSIENPLKDGEFIESKFFKHNFNSLSYFNIDEVIMIPQRYAEAVQDNPKMVSVKDLIQSNTYEFDEDKCDNIVARQGATSEISRQLYKCGINNLITGLVHKIDDIKSENTREMFQMMVVDDSIGVSTVERTYLHTMKQLFGYTAPETDNIITENSKRIASNYPLLKEINNGIRYSEASVETVIHTIIYINAIDGKNPK